jgi:adenine deaminase
LKTPAALIQVARGLAPADLILSNARIVNVFNGEIEHGNLAIFDGRIAGIGNYQSASEIVDLGGEYLLPGYIDGHTHVESSMLDLPRYAEAVVPHGTLGVVTDLHEIANVCGAEGIDYMIQAAQELPFEFFIMAPSCVPATGLETSGASIAADAIRLLLGRKGIIGLGEMMNYPGVLAGSESVLEKIQASGDKPVDGHSPGLSGLDLNAYVSAGISSDHESVSLSEAAEKLARGMYIMIREGSSEKNLEALLPLVTDKTYKRCLFVVDDRSCTDLLGDGDIDAVVRKAIGLGLDPVRAIQLATINAAERFGLAHIGAVAPGYKANLQVVRDLNKPKAQLVYHRGTLVAKDGIHLYKPSKTPQKCLQNTFKVKPLRIEHLRIYTSAPEFPVIEVVPGQIITKKREIKVTKDSSGTVVPDIQNDVLKIIVVERHNATGNIGKGLIKGFGLKHGAIASSIVHDSHNIVAVGTNDDDLLAAVNEIATMQGGLSVVDGGEVLAKLPLPIAGLMSDKPLNEVSEGFTCVEKAVKQLGCKLAAPFATLSFMALPVIPELRLTDLGIVEVTLFRIIETG